MTSRINKARYWTGVLYPENMIEGWEQKIGDIVEVPFAYCIHDKDLDKGDDERKKHVHLILVFPNTTTYKHALGVFKLLSAQGNLAINTCQAIINIRHCYDYLIHDTETCRKEGKYLYSPDERVTGNLFDIGAFEQISTVEKRQMLKDLCDYIIEMRICNLADFYIGASQNFDASYFEVIQGNNAFLDRLTRGNYLKYSEKVRDSEEVQQHDSNTQQYQKKCSHCGSIDIKKNGKTGSDLQRWLCKECNKTFC